MEVKKLCLLIAGGLVCLSACEDHDSRGGGTKGRDARGKCGDGCLPYNLTSEADKLFKTPTQQEEKTQGDPTALAAGAVTQAPAPSVVEAVKPPLKAVDRMDLSRKIHDLINQKTAQITEAEMVHYDEVVTLAGGYKLRMLAIPGGTLSLGSPESEAKRNADEGPQRELRVEPMWMCEVEIPWAVYRAYYENGDAREKDGSLKQADASLPLAELVTQPTPQYMDMFVNGEFASDDDYPAMEMTNHAANKFCQWLSAQTGHFYRLPTEAEWEYACRGGSTSAYPWGDSAERAGEFAWYAENSNFTYQKGKLKKPNAFGLYDMLGNVAEWTLDQYVADNYQHQVDGSSYRWQEPTKRYPRTIRGGSWDSDVEQLRSAARVSSSKDLKYQDPQVPKSIWYHTDAQHIGFRIVRPLRLPDVEMMHRVWNTDEWTNEMNTEDL